MRGGAGRLKLGHGGSGRREMDVAQRVFAAGQVEPLEHGGGQGLGNAPAEFFEQIEDDCGESSARPGGCRRGIRRRA